MAFNYKWDMVVITAPNIGIYRGTSFYPTKFSTQNLGEDVTINVSTTSLVSTSSAQANSYATQCENIPSSGIELSWDDIMNKIPETTDHTLGVDLFGVVYDYLEDVSEQKTLIVKCIRGELKNQSLGAYYNPTLRAQGVDISFSVWLKQGVTSTRVTQASISCRAYKPYTDDVLGTKVCLEFFYASETAGAWEEVDPQLFLGGSSMFTTSNGYKGCWQYNLWSPKMQGNNSFETIFGSHEPNHRDWDDQYGEMSGGDGYGENGELPSHDFSSDDINPTNPPSMSLLTPGFINAYKISASGLSKLGQAIFPTPIFDDPSGITDDITGRQFIFNAINNMTGNIYNGKLIDYIIDCHILPVDVPAGSSSNVRAGGRELINPTSQQPYTAPVVSDSYIQKSCGSLTIPECYGNFLDYTVRCKLYLPFYGYVEIPAEYWNGGTISVDYTFNVIDGTFVAFVKGTAKHSRLNSLIGQYSGCAVTHIPIRGADYSNIVSGIVQTGIGAVGTVAGGGVLTAGMLASGINNLVASKPNMVNNGSSNSSSAMMMHKIPYLIIEYPTPQFSSDYPKEKGLPLNVTASLGQYGGMTIAEDVVLDGIPCTESEKERIRSALKSGLIFR